jgi:hypothetical protein
MAHEKQPRTFRIVHTQVGAWPAGSVVGEHHLEGSDINRLLGLGAITETNLPETDAAPPLNPDELARQNNERVAAAAKNNKGTDTFTGDDIKTMAQQPVPDEGGELSDLTVPELRERAKAANVEGASSMNKQELIDALK